MLNWKIEREKERKRERKREGEEKERRRRSWIQRRKGTKSALYTRKSQETHLYPISWFSALFSEIPKFLIFFFVVERFFPPFFFSMWFGNDFSGLFRSHFLVYIFFKASWFFEGWSKMFFSADFKWKKGHNRDITEPLKVTAQKTSLSIIIV